MTADKPALPSRRIKYPAGVDFFPAAIDIGAYAPPVAVRSSAGTDDGAAADNRSCPLGRFGQCRVKTDAVEMPAVAVRIEPKWLFRRRVLLPQGNQPWCNASRNEFKGVYNSKFL